MSEPWIRDPRPVEQIHAEFWASVRETARQNREIAKLHGAARMDAILRKVWKGPRIDEVLYESVPLFAHLNRNRGNELDEWLAEDNPHRLTHYRVPGVLEALGL